LHPLKKVYQKRVSKVFLFLLGELQNHCSVITRFTLANPASTLCKRNPALPAAGVQIPFLECELEYLPEEAASQICAIEEHTIGVEFLGPELALASFEDALQIHNLSEGQSKIWDLKRKKGTIKVPFFYYGSPGFGTIRPAANWRSENARRAY